MAKKLAAVHAKLFRGHMRIVGTGQTPTGQQFIKGTKVLESPSMRDPRFKQQMRKAIFELFDESPSTE